MRTEFALHVCWLGSEATGVERYNKIASEATANSNDFRCVYASINKLTNVKPHIPPLKDIILLTVNEQIEDWQKHNQCPADTDTAEEAQADNESEVNGRNNPNRNITTEPPSITLRSTGWNLTKLKYGA